MKKEKTISRWALAQRLQAIALALAADKPVKIGRTSVRIPDRVTFEQELESENGEMELELEIKWPGSSGQGRGTATKKPTSAKPKKK